MEAKIQEICYYDQFFMVYKMLLELKWQPFSNPLHI